MRLLLASLFLIPSLSFATCLIEKTICEPANAFQNIYELEKVSCSAPGGPLRVTETFYIKNKLTTKALVKRKLNTTRHFYLQVDITSKNDENYILIDDRRFLQDGEFHISTPKADYMLLDGYHCKRSFR